MPFTNDDAAALIREIQRLPKCYMRDIQLYCLSILDRSITWANSEVSETETTSTLVPEETCVSWDDSSNFGRFEPKYRMITTLTGKKMRVNNLYF